MLGPAAFNTKGPQEPGPVAAQAKHRLLLSPPPPHYGPALDTALESLLPLSRTIVPANHGRRAWASYRGVGLANMTAAL